MTLSPASHQLPVTPLLQQETIIDLPAVQTTDLPAVQTAGLPSVQTTGLPAVQTTGLPSVQTTGAREACQPHWTQAPDVRYPQLGSYQQQAGLAAVGGGDGNTVWPQVHVQLGNAETTAGAHWDKGAKTRSFIHVSLLQPFHKYMQDLMSVRLRCCIYCNAIIFIMMLYIKVCSSLASILPLRTGTRKR